MQSLTEPLWRGARRSMVAYLAPLIDTGHPRGEPQALGQMLWASAHGLVMLRLAGIVADDADCGNSTKRPCPPSCGAPTRNQWQPHHEHAKLAQPSRLARREEKPLNPNPKEATMTISPNLAATNSLQNRSKPHRAVCLAGALMLSASVCLAQRRSRRRRRPPIR